MQSVRCWIATADLRLKIASSMLQDCIATSESNSCRNSLNGQQRDLNKKIYNRHRYYVSNLGGFLRKDNIGLKVVSTPIPMVRCEENNIF